MGCCCSEVKDRPWKTEEKWISSKPPRTKSPGLYNLLKLTCDSSSQEEEDDEEKGEKKESNVKHESRSVSGEGLMTVLLCLTLL